MTYFGEFRVNWRHLLAAAIGMGAGYTINNYLNNVFIPPLMQEFGWPSSSIALIGATSALSVVCQPVAGRLVDRLGVRPVALFGVFMGAVVYILMSLMTGQFWVFLALAMLQMVLVCSTTGAVVYSRLIAQKFDRARGLALATAVCAPSIVGALAVPLLTDFITSHGWRAGYLLAAVGTFAVGLLAVALVPREHRAPPAQHLATSSMVPTRNLRDILRSRAFQLILGGMILCSLSISLQTTQLKVVLLDVGFDTVQASRLISLYALGVIAGRFLSGAALDALPTYLVATIAMSLPGIGLLILASGTSSIFALMIAMLLLGVSLGAEGDVAGYLVMQYFPVEVYSSVLGMVIGAIAFASGVGGLLLSAMLSAGGAFTGFLLMSGVAALVGGTLFWKLGSLEADRVAA